jgi:hypothetical protein
LKRRHVLAFFQKAPPCLVGIIMRQRTGDHSTLASG